MQKSGNGAGAGRGGLRLVEHRGKWALRLDGRRLSTGVAYGPDSRDAAERAARAILTARASQAPAETVAAVIDAWIADMPLRANPKTPSPGIGHAAKNVKAYFAATAPGAVTPAECRAYTLARRAAGRSDGTIRKELGVLAAALRWRGLSPAIERPAPPPPRERWLSRAEVDAVLAREDLPAHIRAFIHVAICTGARAEAILTLRWSQNIDFERRTIALGWKVGGKGRARPLPMTGACEQALKAAQENARTDFVIEWAGEPVASVKRALKAAYARAGVDGIAAPAHVLRHTAGAWMAIEGVPMLEIARRLGHSSIATTERHYAHLHPDHMAASTAALEIKG